MSGRRMIALATLLLLGCQGAPIEGTGTTLEVQPSELVVTLQAQGELVPRIMSSITAPFSGKLEQLAAEGHDVRKGDFVAQLETREQQDRLAELELEQGGAEADLAKLDQDTHTGRLKVRAAVDVARQSLALARHELAMLRRGSDPRRLRDLLIASQVASQSALAAAETLAQKEALVGRGILRATEVGDAKILLILRQRDELVARVRYLLEKAGPVEGTIELQVAEVARAEADVRAAQRAFEVYERTRALERQKLQLRLDRLAARIIELKRQIAEARLVSPIDGTVVLPKTWRNGNFAKFKTGDPVWQSQAFMRVADYRRVDVESEVEEQSISRIRVGMPIRMHLSTEKGRRYRGQVTSIAALASQSKRENPGDGAPKVFTTLCTVIEEAQSFRPGLSVEVEYELARHPEVLVIPVGSILQDRAGPHVLMAGGERRRVRLGDRQESRVIVVEGLRAGERIRAGAPEEGR